MNKKTRASKKNRLKKLEKKYSKLIQHHDLVEEAIEVKAEMDSLRRELKS
ncbi:hypothetical protein [Methanobrevibacter sp.]